MCLIIVPGKTTVLHAKPSNVYINCECVKNI